MELSQPSNPIVVAWLSPASHADTSRSIRRRFGQYGWQHDALAQCGVGTVDGHQLVL